jgi:hypothetical protein
MISDSNKIKFIDGEAFQKLNKLEFVSLYKNICIDEEFINPSRIAVLQETVNEKCQLKASKITPHETTAVIEVETIESEDATTESENDSTTINSNEMPEF